MLPLDARPSCGSPHLKLVAIDRIRRPAFDAWAASMQRVRHRSSASPDSGAPDGACSTAVLENISFMEGDFQQLPMHDMLTAAPSLILCVHGCNEVTLREHVCIVYIVHAHASMATRGIHSIVLVLCYR